MYIGGLLKYFYLFVVNPVNSEDNECLLIMINELSINDLFLFIFHVLTVWNRYLNGSIANFQFITYFRYRVKRKSYTVITIIHYEILFG